MKKVLHASLWSLLALALLFAPWSASGNRAAAAEELKPVAVVSLAGPEVLMKDVRYLTEAAGVPEWGALATMLATPYTSPLDKDKPLGVLVIQDASAVETGGFAPLVFIPVKDLKALLSALEPQVGKPSDAGEGLLEFGTPDGKSVFLKEQKGWAFLSNNKGTLANLPANPAKLLGGLDSRYTLAIKVNLSLLPGEWRTMVNEQMKKGFEEGMNRRTSSAQERELAEKFGTSFLKTMTDIVEGLDQVAIGWKINAEKKATYLDLAITAVKGSELSKQLATVKMSKSAFAGFQLPNAAATLHLTAKSSAQEIAQALDMLKVLRQAANKGLEEDANLGDEDRKQVKELLGQLVDLLESTVKLGQTDAGAVVLLKPDALRIAAGGLVADGDKLAATLKKIAALAKEKNIPNFPEIKFDAETYEGVTFHTLSIPLKTDKKEALKLLGESLDVVIGTGGKSAYIALGKEPSALLKQILDKSAADADKELPPSEFAIALTPILEVAASMSDNPVVSKTLEALQKAEGKDHIIVRTVPTERGMVCHFEVEGGVVKVIGDVARTVGPMLQRMGQ